MKRIELQRQAPVNQQVNSVSTIPRKFDEQSIASESRSEAAHISTFTYRDRMNGVVIGAWRDGRHALGWRLKNCWNACMLIVDSIVLGNAALAIGTELAA